MKNMENMNWRDKATKRYEEYADVHSEANFTALQRALDIAYEAGRLSLNTK